MARRRPILRLPALLTLCALGAMGSPVQAQFGLVPASMTSGSWGGGGAWASRAEHGAQYRLDGARHLYASYPQRIFRGRLPPLLHGVAVVDIDVGSRGEVLDVRMRRWPVNAEVGPWIVEMIRRAAPFPVPERIGRVTYSDIWLVHKGGNFQLDTLTEGQD